MIYTPFLKAKQHEILAVGSLPADVLSKICPLFDFPKRGAGYNAETLADSVGKTVKSFRKHLGRLSEIYIDSFDLDEAVRPGGKHCYRYLLEAFAEFPVIPVVSVDRSDEHLESISEAKADGLVESSTVACRLTKEYFESFEAIEAEIGELLEPVFESFDRVDLLLDLRYCGGFDVVSLAARVRDFAEKFCARYGTRRTVITGSSIPASISDLLKTQSELILPRTEVAVYSALVDAGISPPLTFGDYTIVSPNYSEADLTPAMLQNVITGKLAYSYDDKHYIVRGGKLKTDRNQYQRLAESICEQDFFRGENYSSGDKFFAEKMLGLGSRCMPHTVIKPSIVSHISYTVSKLQG